MKFKYSNILILFFVVTGLLVSSCSNIRYSYYTKHKVPYSSPAETKFAKAIPAKPFLTQTETALKEKPVQEKDMTAKNTIVAKSEKNNTAAQPVQQKVENNFDVTKFFREHKYFITAKDSVEIDQRTLMIILLVVLILVLLALVGNDLLWLLWVALLVILILILIKYLGLFN